MISVLTFTRMKCLLYCCELKCQVITTFIKMLSRAQVWLPFLPHCCLSPNRLCQSQARINPSEEHDPRCASLENDFLTTHVLKAFKHPHQRRKASFWILLPTRQTRSEWTRWYFKHILRNRKQSNPTVSTIEFLPELSCLPW